MSRFNTAVKTGVRSEIVSNSRTPDAVTALGGAGFTRTAKSELFLLAVSNMSDPKGAFHEDGTARDIRFTTLLQSQEVISDAAWCKGFITYLRTEANIRSASIVAAAEIVAARLARGITGNRDLVQAALQRPDEPGEFLAYWTSTHGKNIPQPVKRGVADAIDRLYREKSFLKYDSESKGFRFADVLQLTHPDALRGRLSAAEYKALVAVEEGGEPWSLLVSRKLVDKAGRITDEGERLLYEVRSRNTLYKFILDNRYGSPETPETLPVIRARAALMELPVPERRNVTAGQLEEAGMTWESLAGWLQGPLDAAAWEKIIPSMGAMALLRNLRNFDQAGISKNARRIVEDKLGDPEEIRRSRQLPMRFLNAYRATRDSGTVTAWGPVIEEALSYSLQNVPALAGRSLVLVDLSGSMYDRKLSDRSDLTWADAAAVFGAATAKRSEGADLYGFGSVVRHFPFTAQSSLLPLATSISEIEINGSEFGWYNQTIKGLGGTETVKALQETWVPGKYDRIVIVTDEQYQGWGRSAQNVNQFLESTGVNCYTWNLAGYQTGQARSGSNKLHTFGGLSDSGFKVIAAIEQGQSGGFPWERVSTV